MNAEHNHASLTTNRRRLMVAFFITLFVFVSQFVGSIVTGSLALLVDTAHMFTDVLGLLMALTAASLMLRPASDTHTWGFRRAEVIGATLQALILLGIGVYALIEGVRRIFTPAEVPGKLLLIFAAIGLAANLVSLFVLMDQKNSNLNMKAAFLEVLTDALGSIAVIISALTMIFFGFTRADSIAAIIIAAMILPRAVYLAKQALEVLLEKTPAEFDLKEIREHLESHEDVLSIHDLHLTRISSDYPVLTAHVAVKDESFYNGRIPQILDDLQECVEEHFPIRIEHATFQLEPQSKHSDAC